MGKFKLNTESLLRKVLEFYSSDSSWDEMLQVSHQMMTVAEKDAGFFAKKALLAKDDMELLMLVLDINEIPLNKLIQKTNLSPSVLSDAVKNKTDASQIKVIEKALETIFRS